MLSQKNEYLFFKIQDKYNKEIETPYLEEKKKRLEEVRSMKKPIDREDLTDH